MPLSIDQQSVADMFMKFVSTPHEKEMVILGSPGCGKSYLTKHLIDLLRKSNTLTHLLSPGSSGVKIHCTATTNKAARVLADFTGEPAQTIHALLGLKVTNNLFTGKTSLKKTSNYAVVEDSVVFIDEASQEDTHLLHTIRSSTMNCKVVHIGDPYQLTSVHETISPVFKDIKLQGILTNSQRFTPGGPIDTLATGYRNAIDTGVFPVINIDDKNIKHCNGESFRDEINYEFLHARNLHENHAKIMAWSNVKVRAYNSYVRGLHTSFEAFEVGEKVITNKPILGRNGRTAYHTEQAAIVSSITAGEEHDIPGWWITLSNETHVFQPKDPQMIKLLVKQAAIKAKETKDWSKYFSIQDFFADLRPIHASTIHKAQGSTYNKVFIDLDDISRCHQPNVVARLLHVAISRASKQVILYGNLPPKYGSINHGS